MILMSHGHKKFHCDYQIFHVIRPLWPPSFIPIIQAFSNTVSQFHKYPHSLAPFNSTVHESRQQYLSSASNVLGLMKHGLTKPAETANSEEKANHEKNK